MPMKQEEITKWVEEVLRPVLRGEPVKGEVALLSADADRIKDYVFESAKLPEIRGASMILDELNQGWPDDEGPNIRKLFSARGLPVGHKDNLNALSCIVYAGGGSLLALVPPDLAKTLKADIETLYPRETDAATITCVRRKVSPAELWDGYRPEGLDYAALLALQDKLSEAEWQRIADYYHECGENGSEVTSEQFARRRNFGQVMALQSVELRKAKEEKAVGPLFEAVPFARRCESCGIRPANCFFKPTPLPGRYLCEVCLTKVQRSTQLGGKKEWTRQFEQFLHDADEICDAVAYLGGMNWDGLRDVVGAEDVSEIGAASRERGYIGFIYADGNGVGSLVESSDTIAEYRRKSNILVTTMSKVVFAALCRHLRIRRHVQRTKSDGSKYWVDIHPFEIITIGGDDVLLIVPGDQALAIAYEICHAFEVELVDREFDPATYATMSAGVVIADHHNPIYFLRGLADELLKKSAKKRARELVADPGERAQGTVDFLVLKSQSMVATTVGHLRGAPPYRFTDRHNKTTTLLTGRPFTLEEVNRLVDTVQALEVFSFPGSQLQGLREMLYRGRMMSTLYYLYQYARANQNRRKLLAWIEEQWGMRNARNPPPWVHVGRKRGFDRYATPWPDIIEVQEFIPRPSGEKKRWLKERILDEGGEAVASGD